MKRSALCFGAFLFDSHFEIHLQKGSVTCIYSIASNLSPEKNVGAMFPVLVVTGIMASVCGMESPSGCYWAVLLMILKTGPSECVADSMLIGLGVFWGNSTGCDRQFVALLHAPDIHSKVKLYVASSSPYLLT